MLLLLLFEHLAQVYCCYSLRNKKNCEGNKPELEGHLPCQLQTSTIAFTKLSSLDCEFVLRARTMLYLISEPSIVHGS